MIIPAWNPKMWAHQVQVTLQNNSRDLPGVVTSKEPDTKSMPTKVPELNHRNTSLLLS